MGCLTIALITIAAIASLFAAMYFMATGSVVIGLVFLVLCVVFFAVASIQSTNMRNKKYISYFENTPDVSFLRIGHKILDGNLYIDYLEGPQVKIEDYLFNSTPSYITHGVVSGNHTARVKFTVYGKDTREITLSEQTISFSLEKDKFYQIHYDKQSDTFTVSEVPVPRDFKKIIKLKNSIKRVN